MQVLGERGSKKQSPGHGTHKLHIANNMMVRWQEQGKQRTETDSYVTSEPGRWKWRGGRGEEQYWEWEFYSGSR